MFSYILIRKIRDIFQGLLLTIKILLPFVLATASVAVVRAKSFMKRVQCNVRLPAKIAESLRKESQETNRPIQTLVDIACEQFITKPVAVRRVAIFDRPERKGGRA